MSSDLIDITDAWKVYHVGEVQVPAVRGAENFISTCAMRTWLPEPR